MSEKKIFTRYIKICIVLGILLSGIHLVLSQEIPPYKNLELALEERVNDLLSRMTIEEKAHQLASFFPNANVRLVSPICKQERHSTAFVCHIQLVSPWQ